MGHADRKSQSKQGPGTPDVDISVQAETYASKDENNLISVLNPGGSTTLEESCASAHGYRINTSSHLCNCTYGHPCAELIENRSIKYSNDKGSNGDPLNGTLTFKRRGCYCKWTNTCDFAIYGSPSVECVFVAGGHAGIP